MSETVGLEVEFCKYAADNCSIQLNAHSMYPDGFKNNTTVSDIVFF